LSFSTPIYRDLPINDHRRESIGSAVLDLDNLMPLSCQLPPRLGFSASCSIARYSHPSHVNVSVLSRFLLVRLTGTDFPFTSTVLRLIICCAIDANSAVSSMPLQLFWRYCEVRALSDHGVGRWRCFLNRDRSQLHSLYTQPRPQYLNAIWQSYRNRSPESVLSYLWRCSKNAVRACHWCSSPPPHRQRTHVWFWRWRGRYHASYLLVLQE
jgi:hypothetical protein